MKEWEEKISNMLNEVSKQIADLEEARLIKACDENDFIVGTPIVREQIKALLPSNANILVDMRIEPNKIYMIKKMELIDLLTL